ncbi:MAG: glucose-1-phosphate cytidylyltransferase [Planctomycetes bacterium]|nr:glucose-1-phosphate cytidylyltransferase [Planctomycetota bacterium]
MKVGILAGGVGTRLSEETEVKPKPMVEIGGKPILWHIMKIYAAQGYKDFVIALGYRGEYIKRYMLDFCSLSSNLTVNVRTGVVEKETNDGIDDWSVRLIDTGLETATGGRIKRLAPYLQGEGTFLLTWGDGVFDIDLGKLLAFHRDHGKLATIAAVRPPARFGMMELDEERVVRYTEKPQIGEGWISGGVFALEPGIFSYIEDDRTQWEKQPLERLAEEGELMAFKHYGFWQCMDTLRDKKHLEQMWESNPPWKIWR